jgi:hypothetical protein
MKHKFHDVIMAYSLGKDVECKYKQSDIWKPVLPFLSRNTLNTFPNFNDTELDFRIKPITKTGEYRVALLKFSCGETLVVTEDSTGRGSMKSNKNFVKYLTDWVQYEYEVKDQNIE